jgi:hypothetical protein
MVTPDIRQGHGVAVCSDEDMDWEEFSQHSSENGDPSFTHDPYGKPDWQRQWPLQFSMNASVKAAGNPGEPRENTKWAQGGQQSTNEQSGRKIGRLLTSAGL